MGLQPEALQQITQYLAAVVGAGTHVRDRAELLQQHGLRGLYRALAPNLAKQGGFGLAGAHRGRGHATGADGDVDHTLLRIQLQTDCQAHG